MIRVLLIMASLLYPYALLAQTMSAQDAQGCLNNAISQLGQASFEILLQQGIDVPTLSARSIRYSSLGRLSYDDLNSEQRARFAQVISNMLAGNLPSSIPTIHFADIVVDTITTARGGRSVGPAYDQAGTFKDRWGTSHQFSLLWYIRNGRCILLDGSWNNISFAQVVGNSY